MANQGSSDLSSLIYRNDCNWWTCDLQASCTFYKSRKVNIQIFENRFSNRLFSRYTRKVICVELTLYSSVHTRFTAIRNYLIDVTHSSLASMIIQRFKGYRCESGIPMLTWRVTWHPTLTSLSSVYGLI